jgi:hypothetical protein
VTSRIAVTDTDGIVVVQFLDLDAAVSGCDMDKIDALAGELASLAEKDPVGMILDFEGKVFVPVAAFECVLVKIHQKLNARLGICNLPTNVAQHFDANQLATLFHIHDSLEGALEAVKNAGRKA